MFAAEHRYNKALQNQFLKSAMILLCIGCRIETDRTFPGGNVMPRFEVIQGEGLNPIQKDDLPSIIFFDAPESLEEWEAQKRAVIENDRRLRGFRGVISTEI